MKEVFAFFILAAAVGAQANLLTNGDFELGNTGFSSDYVHSPLDYTPEGIYAVDTNPNNHHSLWLSYGDHTSGAGKMLIINGRTSIGTSPWYQTVSLVGGTSYSFSAWVRSPYSPESLQLGLNGSVLSGSTVSVSTTAWSQWTYTIVAPSTGSHVIQLLPPSTASAGNDYTVDDISLRVVPEPASIASLAAGVALLALRRKK